LNVISDLFAGAWYRNTDITSEELRKKKKKLQPTKNTQRFIKKLLSHFLHPSNPSKYPLIHGLDSFIISLLKQMCLDRKEVGINWQAMQKN